MNSSRYATYALLGLCLFSAACNLAGRPESASEDAVGRDAIAIDFLSTRANGLLSSCARGEANSCDRAQRQEEISEDGVFSRIHVACDAGQQIYCDLRKGLVDAELRMRGV